MICKAKILIRSEKMLYYILEKVVFKNKYILNNGKEMIMKKILKLLGICIGLLLISFFSSMIVTGIFAIVIEDSKEMSKYIYIITCIIDVIILILVDWMYSIFNKKLLSKDVFKKIKLNEVINISLLGVGLSVCGSILAGELTEVFPSYVNVANQLSVKSLDQMIITILIIPIFEEIIFRRIIFGYLKENYTVVYAIIVQALIFGIAHGNIVQGICAFLIGIVLAIIYMYCDSLVGSMILHMVLNLCGTLIIPKLLAINEIMGYIVFISGILCLVFSILKMKKNMEKSFENRECNN
ncbi:CAAX protease self-immunity family protein [[Clostridium] bifermentans ATCC 19299]|uniref:CPBP family intramembrane glutamic endopeptidase n=2 Tax=Paraclostridium bifermentans TaxID=1490 RepID=UPI00038D7F07|nr:type II CAAX endopeptidase family protein [Paraclostridium bifermentans]EQK39616.1 CAAX protease self-immunity family protein [[Clostridium] bifermentans ATCC 19299] [Paraclostridium bifermentans ATCC 19299]